MVLLSAEIVLKENHRVVRRLIPLWLAIGVALLFFADVAFKNVFLYVLVPWIGWLLFGSTIFALSARNALWLRGLGRIRLAIATLSAVPLAGVLLALSAPALVSAGEKVVCCSPPADDALAAQFRRQRAEFEELLTMFREDSALGRVDYDFTRPANFFSGKALRPSPPLSEARWKAYRQLFDRLALSGGGIEGYDDKHVIYFWRYADGMGAGLGGSGKGFAYSDSLQSDTPAAMGCETPRSDCWQFRPIAGSWFVLEERHD
jgi:hypothetical protein